MTLEAIRAAQKTRKPCYRRKDSAMSLKC